MHVDTASCCYRFAPIRGIIQGLGPGPCGEADGSFQYQVVEEVLDSQTLPMEGVTTLHACDVLLQARGDRSARFEIPSRLPQAYHRSAIYGSA